MELNILANWLYAIQVFLSANNLERRFMVVESGSFKTGCVTNINCGIGKLIN